MKKALILNAINRSLAGVLIRGDKGTAKSTAVRGLAALLPQVEEVADCPFHCDPYDPSWRCSRCRERSAAGETLPIVQTRVRVVDLPLNTTEDRLVGSLDFEHALQTGAKRFQPGILAEANRGIIYIDEVNLLEDNGREVPTANDTLRFDLGAYEIKTFKVKLTPREGRE